MSDEEFHKYCKETRAPLIWLGILLLIVMLATLGDCLHA
jgi:hypothetical protein